jgi:hypothetical protein
VDLNGQSGDDSFIVRSFMALLIDPQSGEALGRDSKGIRAVGGNDNDSFDIKAKGKESGPSEIEAYRIKEQDPNYVVNSLVDVDGGGGSDTLFVSGTEADDLYVLTSEAIFGGGLTITFANIESLQLDMREGNDLVSVLSTSPTVSTVLYGNLGSDSFQVRMKFVHCMPAKLFPNKTKNYSFLALLQITPREVAPVTSHNLRGHTGLLEHEISSNDAKYDGMLMEGVAVHVLDNNG